MRASDRPVAVLVDGYTAGSYLPPAFAKQGADSVHVQSTPELYQSMPAPDFSVYDATIVHEDTAKTVAQLARYPAVCVVAGMEPGVLLADELSDALGLPTNGASSARQRRDKYEMIEALRSAGLHCARQFKSSDAAAIVDWAEHDGPYPFVVKPLDSAATDGVQVCQNAAEVYQAAKNVLTTKNIYDRVNEEALIQSFLAGSEYVVDMVSYAGTRYAIGVWKYNKRIVSGTRNIYDTERLLPPDESPVPELISYVNSALDALNVRFGPSHAEVIVTPEGPALVEVGTRMAGNMHPGFHDHCAGANQADLTALAFLCPAQFVQRYGGRTYQKRQEALCYLAPTELSGIVDRVDERVVDEIRGLDTVFGLNVKVKPGDRIRPTIDLFSSTLRIFMAGESYQDILRDYGRLQDLKDRVFVVR
jgi:biotin carboxylase